MEITKVITKLKTEDLEEAAAYKDRLTLELNELRRKYLALKKKGSDTHMLAKIERQGLDLVATIEKIPQHPPLRVLQKQDEDLTVQSVGELICWLIENLNVSNSMTANQIETAAHMIIEQCGHLRIEDIAIVMREALQGRYGTLYNRLDVSMILEWLEKYSSDLQQQRHQKQMDKYMNNKESRHEVQRTSDADIASERAVHIKYILENTNINNGKP